FLALPFITVLPRETWPSPPMTTLPLRRTETMVVKGISPRCGADGPNAKGYGGGSTGLQAECDKRLRRSRRSPPVGPASCRPAERRFSPVVAVAALSAGINPAPQRCLAPAPLSRWGRLDAGRRSGGSRLPLRSLPCRPG